MHKVRIDKAIPNAQTPRVEKLKSNPKNNDNRERIRDYLMTKSTARIPQRNMHLRQSTRTTEQAQLIRNDGAAAAAAQQRDGGGSLVAARRR